jgi:hypothetical protein
LEAREANAKNHNHLFAIGFAIPPNARELVEQSRPFGQHDPQAHPLAPSAPIRYPE